MKKVYSFLVLLLIALSPFATRAQMTVQASATAADMANMLVGGGLVVINPTMNCHDSGKGIFRGMSTVGFDSGVVLTCGRANTIGAGNVGVNGPASLFAATSWSRPGDATLQTLTTLTLHDACTIEFDFRPTGDTIKFDYVWGSEEYTGFTCSASFNDVFGFFISGPGYSTPTNIAKVPGTNIPVCINSINCGPTGFNPLSNCTMLGPGSPFCTYYVNNSTGTSVVYDGLTTNLTAIAAVTPCDTYHLKLGVADASDWTLDSGVFLKAGSLSSTSTHVTPVGTNPLDTAVGTQYCVRGCSPGKFVFTKGAPAAAATTIKYQLGGTAVNGVDYFPIADSVVIPAGSTTASVFIYGIPKSPAVGPKIVRLYLLSATSCGGAQAIVDSAQIIIYDSFAVKINTTDTAICLGQNVQISASADPTLKVWWISSPMGSLSNDSLLNPIATPTVNTTYTIFAVDPGPGCKPSQDVLNVTVIPPPTVFVGDPIKKTCVGRSPALPVEAIAYPPASYYSYQWVASPTAATAWLSSTSVANPSINPTNTNGTSDIDTGNVVFTVTARVGAVAVGCSTSQSFTLHILPDKFNLYSAHDTDVCYPADSFQMNADGCSEFAWEWKSDFGVSDPSIMNPFIRPPGGAVGVQSTVYTLTATSLPGCAPITREAKFNVYRPDVKILTGKYVGTGDTTVCPTLPVTIRIDTPSGNPTSITWSPTTSLTNFGGAQPDFFSVDTGDHIYWVKIVDGPGCTDSDKVNIRVSPPVKISASPYSFGLDSVYISLGEQHQLNCTLLSQDPVIYYWRPNDGSLNDPNINNPVAKPSETTMYTVYAMNLWGCRDTANIKIIVDPGTDEFIPSAFTPNGDGLNDLFRINLKYQKLVDFRVFNRWGQLVYENTSSDSKKGWDGTVNGVLQDMGVYHYSIMVQKPSGEKKLYNGDVTLIR